MDLEWSKWIRYLDASLDAQEQEDFRFWVIAQQDPKKFPWSRKKRKQELSSVAIAEKAMRFAKDKMGAVDTLRSDVYQVAQTRGLKSYVRVQAEDGSVKYYDEDGSEIAPPRGSVFIPSKIATRMKQRG
jgi:hypothetical protein